MARFGSDFLKKLEYLSLVSKRAFRGSILAQRRTMQLGGGIEFTDHCGCTLTATNIPFDELILKMMRVAGAVR